MMRSTRPTTTPSLLAIRREVQKHFAAVDQEVRAIRVSRAADRSVNLTLSQRLAGLRRRLQEFGNVGPMPTEAPAVPVARRTPQERLRFLSKFRRDLAHTPGKLTRLDPSHRQPRLRLFSPTSPV